MVHTGDVNPGDHLGEEVGRGVRSVVFRLGEADVAKVSSPDIPISWLQEECRLHTSVARAGAAVPARPRLLEVDGRPVLASAQIHGPSMWEALTDDPSKAVALGAELARIQTQLTTLQPSFELPAQHDRITSKIHAAARRHGREFPGVLDLIPSDSDPLVLCHGDLHPRNVLLSANGPVLVGRY